MLFHISHFLHFSAITLNKYCYKCKISYCAAKSKYVFSVNEYKNVLLLNLKFNIKKTSDRALLYCNVNCQKRKNIVGFSASFRHAVICIAE